MRVQPVVSIVVLVLSASCGKGDDTGSTGAPQAAAPHAAAPQPAAKQDAHAGDAPLSASAVKACDDVVTAYQKFLDCDKLKAAGEAAVKAQRDVLEALKQQLPATNARTAETCKLALDALASSAKLIGCEL